MSNKFIQLVSHRLDREIVRRDGTIDQVVGQQTLFGLTESGDVYYLHDFGSWEWKLFIENDERYERKD